MAPFTEKTSYAKVCARQTPLNGKPISRSRENPSKMRRKVKFYYFFGFTAIRFRLTDAMHLIQRALESPDLEEHFQYQIQCEKIKKKFLETF